MIKYYNRERYERGVDKMYKLIALDMDGTLLNKNGEVSEGNKIAIKKAIEKGIKVVLCSGRNIDGLEKFLEELSLKEDGQYIITCNGGAIYSCHDKKVISSIMMKGKDIHKISKLSKELGIKMQVYTLDKCIATEENEYTEFERNHIGTTIKIINDYNEINEDEELMKALLLEKAEILDEKIKKIPQEYREKYNLVKSLPQTLEVMPKNCNKAIGIKNLIEKIGIKPEEVIAIGDECNDLEMIEFAGLGVAMGNGNVKVKEIANYITESNNEDGVAKVIEKFILKK